MCVKLIFWATVVMVTVSETVSVYNLLYSHTKFDFKGKSDNKLADLIFYIATHYLTECVPYLLYDEFFYETYVYKDTLFQTMDKLNAIPYIHGFIDKFNMTQIFEGTGRQFCFHYVIFCNDEDTIINKLDFQLTSKVVFVTTMSKYQLQEFIQTPGARNILNFLLISDPVMQREDYKVRTLSKDINLYTHKLHVDGIGSSILRILTSWRKNKLTRSDVNLFPPKLDDGFNGHQIQVAAFEQPPFVFRKKRSTTSSDDLSAWDGLEVRLLRMIADSLNFGLSIRDTYTEDESKGSDEVVAIISKGKADIGISGIYVTRRYYETIYFSTTHSQDCGVFITLSSTAIPKYRAILGPFQWLVWICIIGIYMFAIIPISYSDKLSCRNLFESSEEVGTLLWMVFGTFTNLFTYKPDKSLNKTKKNSTCVMIGTYWVFTIIITAAYSSSIISFITIPTYFEVVDNADDLLEEDYRVGVLDARDWKSWFNDTTDQKMNKLMKNVDIINSTGLALTKVAKEENYAFLGSENMLSYLVRSNFTASGDRKKSMFHIASQCVAPFMVSFAIKQKTDFLLKFDQQIQRFLENGFVAKIRRDIEWEVLRSSKGKLFTAASAVLRVDNVEDRQLTVDDTQGMFLLLGIGVTFAGASLLHECVFGYQCFARIGSSRTGRSVVPSIMLTPCEDDDKEVPQIVRKLSSVCKRTVSASISVSDYLTEKAYSTARRFSH